MADEAAGRNEAARKMVESLVKENRELRLRVLEERLIGLQAQEKLARLLIEQTQAEITRLRDSGQ
jgi:RNase H-fold protein (predicted Holliday junction resolvase)